MRDLSEAAAGACDASPILQTRLDARGEVRIPAGTYRLEAPLLIHSDTSLVADPGATFRLADGVGQDCRDFVLTNANPGNGNAHISVTGGVWDANNAGNPRGTDGDLFAYSGVALNFTNVRHLTLRDLTVHNPESFFIRLGEVRDFEVADITLSADSIRLNQDGVHVGGYCERGVIRGIRASGAGVPNDDMVALNADDDVERQLNLGMRRGPIRDILVEDIEAEDAYTFIRLLSVDQPIENITIRRLKGGCRMHGLNLNNWRFPKGVGAIRNVTIEDVRLTKTACNHAAPAIVKISLRVDALRLRGLKRGERTLPEVKTLLIDNQQALTMTEATGDTAIDPADGLCIESGDIDALELQAR